MGKHEDTKNKDFESACIKSPPDGGWGWMVVVGGVIVHMLVGGYSRVYSLIYEHLRNQFGSSASLTAIVGSLFISFRYLLSPISIRLVARFGTRKVVFIGSLLLGVGCTLNAFATSTEFMLFSYSLIAGSGAGLVYGPSQVLIASYFSKKRGIALGITTSGSSFGALLLIQLNIRLFDSIGFRSALLVTGVIMFGGVISAMLYRPLINKSRESSNLSICSESSIHKLNDISDLEEDKTDEKGGSPLCLVKKMSDGEKISAVSFIGDDGDAPNYGKRERNGCCTRLTRALHLDTLRDPSFALFTVATSWCVLCSCTVSLMIVSVEIEMGTTERQAATLLSALSISDTAGRILSGIFFDLRIIRSRRIIPYCISCLVMGATLLGWPLVTDYGYRIAMSIALGVFNGTLVAQRTNVLCDLVGVYNLSTAYATLAGYQGVCSLIGPGVFGVVRDVYGTYRYVMFALGGGACAASAIMALAVICGNGTPDELESNELKVDVNK